mmetsp:Transcript_9567/g.20380  ORF Transcript_9567/g.20380 Transcript_9567/m.20380 type:complete len:233 (-) Transcript_9567:1491-2189(-)
MSCMHAWCGQARRCLEGGRLAGNCLDQAADHLILGHRPQLLPTQQPDSQSVVLHLLLAHYAHDGGLGLLGVTDELRDGGATIHLRADTCPGHGLGHGLGIGRDLIVEGEEANLCGCHPQGEGARVVLNQDAEEALDGAKDGAVDHDGALLGVLAVNVLHVKPLGQVVVQLDGGTLPLAPDGVLDLDVDLGAVESTTASVHGVVPALALQGLHQSALGNGPEVLIPHTLLGPC